jgi:hypothetical protein
MTNYLFGISIILVVVQPPSSYVLYDHDDTSNRSIEQIPDPKRLPINTQNDYDKFLLLLLLINSDTETSQEIPGKQCPMKRPIISGDKNKENGIF